MLKITNNGNIIEISATGKLASGDFALLAKTADPIIEKNGHIFLLVNATEMGGWENIRALKAHLCFVCSRQRKIKSLAFIQAHIWQKALMMTARLFLSPTVKIFSKGDENKARKWLEQEA